eukprot:CAMPEP_0184646096 /NCGR_PEP_ID=MMETSP0308-20130426/2739_1 /TAXON_ID=38269 /ORGANISM="Gloeochaete witrockiana, Strain SAG 46.84" /LENGTH=256 /DNA_ID=CAMNT_0027075783 /DNA_START=224 /DNA_END=994 /DNA_ORIENTATION=-
MEELEKHVTAFVVVESTSTHSGLPKNLSFVDAASEGHFDRWLHLIRFIPADEMPNCTEDSWVCERYQRDLIIQGLYDVSGNDLAIVSDCDEIVNAQAADWLRCNTPADFAVGRLAMALHYYSLHWRKRAWWLHGAVLTGHALQTIYNNQPSLVRTPQALPWVVTIPNAGWHFSYFMPVEGIQKKLFSFAHREYSVAPYTDPDYIASRIRQGEDLYGRTGSEELEYVEDPFPVPIAVTRNPIKFSSFYAYEKLGPQV